MPNEHEAGGGILQTAALGKVTDDTTVAPAAASCSVGSLGTDTSSAGCAQTGERWGIAGRRSW